MPYIGFWGALLIAPLLTAVIGLIVERVLIRPLYGRDPLYSLLLTFGLAFILEDGTRYIWGAQSVPVTDPGWLAQPLSSDFFFLTGYRLFMVALVVVAVAALFSILATRRLGMRIRAGTLDLETVSVLGVNVRHAAQPQFRARHLSRRLAGVLAAGMLGLQPTIGTSLIMPSFIAIIVGGARQPARHAARRPADRRRLGRHRGVLPVGERSGDVRDDGARAADPAARPARRRRQMT